MILAELIREYKVAKEPLVEYLISKNIDILEDGSIPQKHFQTVIEFIEKQEDRIEKSMNGKYLGYSSPDNKNIIK